MLLRENDMDNGLEETKREFLGMTDKEIIKEAKRIANGRKAQGKAHRRYKIARGLYIGFSMCSALVALAFYIVGFATDNPDLQMWCALVLIVSIPSNMGLWSLLS